jgi:hypothetical protein
MHRNDTPVLVESDLFGATTPGGREADLFGFNCAAGGRESDLFGWATAGGREADLFGLGGGEAW